MPITYEIKETEYGKCVLKIENDVISEIPIDFGNSDYQRYLRWLENPDADEAQSL
jgi:hypothetical protein